MFHVEHLEPIDFITNKRKSKQFEGIQRKREKRKPLPVVGLLTDLIRCLYFNYFYAQNRII